MRSPSRTTLRLCTLAPLLLILLLAAPALAQTAPLAGKPGDSLACRSQCNAVGLDREGNTGPVRACLIRCTAGERYLALQHQRGTPEATGRGTALRSDQTATRATAWPSRNRQNARALVAYAGELPGRGLGVSLGAERMAAHRAAETECFRHNASRPCRLLLETAERCISIARGVRQLGLVLTANPETYTIVNYGTGTGATDNVAQFGALQDCNQRANPGVQCRVVATRCAG